MSSQKWDYQVVVEEISPSVEDSERLLPSPSTSSQSSTSTTNFVKNDDDLDLPSGTIYWRETKLLLKASLPLNLSNLLQFSVNLTTAYVAGGDGRECLAALSLGTTIANITCYALFEGLVGSLDTLGSQAFGSKKYHLLGIQLQRVLVFALLVFIPIAVSWLFSPRIFDSFVEDKVVANLAGRYLQVLTLAIPGNVLFEAGKRFVQVQGYELVPLHITLVTAPAHFGLSYVFVRNLGWGLEGAALATVIFNMLNPLLLVIYILYLIPQCLVCWPGLTRRALQDWGHVIRLSVSGMVQMWSEWLAIDMLAICASYISTPFLAAHTIMLTTMTVVYHIPQPMAISAGQRIGELVGLGRVRRISKVLQTHLAMAALAGLFNFALVLSMKDLIPKIFSADPDVARIAHDALLVVSFGVMLDAMLAMTAGILRGIGRQHIGCWVNILVYYPFAIPLSLFLVWGPAQLVNTGLWVGPISGFIFIVSIEIGYIWRVDWGQVVRECRVRNGDLQDDGDDERESIELAVRFEKAYEL
ncbi:mate-domain-containing protein [Apodospora peruviana]|uniref:Mate-domain-containing protein n=1 Tax=Apodospora peruviana TaxID=516989 RepID=A0AAE0M8D1_9PEZI|nr:mate-domain-containing protein [Apodospora peruviana]